MTAIAHDTEIAEALSTSTPPRRLLPATRKRILLADDSPQIRESLGKLLRRSNYDVAFAAHGGHVLDLVLNQEFDLLLLDLNMPQMDGWDALDHLSSMRPTLPIIIITAQPNQGEWAMSAGAHALMEKPLDLALLLQTIEEFLREPPVHSSSSKANKRKGFRHAWPRRNGSGPRDRVHSGGINE